MHINTFVFILHASVMVQLQYHIEKKINNEQQSEALTIKHNFNCYGSDTQITLGNFLVIRHLLAWTSA